MTQSEITPQTDLGTVVSNAFGEHYLFAINRNLFQGTDASTVFRSQFNEQLFKEDSLYIIAGTDSGLLLQYVKSQGVPRGSSYLFVEPPEVLEHLVEMDDPDGEVRVAIPDKWQETAIRDLDFAGFAVQDRIEIIRSLGVVHGHYGEYRPLWRQLREEYFMRIRSFRIGMNHRPFAVSQIDNLAENETTTVFLKDIFKGKTAVLLAGGPSLDEILPWVRDNRDNLLVIAVARVCYSLIQSDIQPDIVVAVDPYHMTLYVNRDMFEFQDSTLFVHEFHVSSNLLASWGGQNAFVGKRYPWTTPLEPGNLPSSPGITVTNTAFAVGVATGISQLILGGADFCFSQSGHTHASGSTEHKLGSQPMLGDRRVETNGGFMADTDKTFVNSANSIEKQAEEAQGLGCHVINPSPNSMRMQHVEHITLDNISVPNMEKPAMDVINERLPKHDKGARIAYYNEALGEVDRVLKELRELKELANKALDYNRKLFDKSNKEKSRHYHNKLEHIEKQLKEKHASTDMFIKHIGLMRFVPLMRASEEDAEKIEENSRLYFEAYLATCKELLELLGKSRHRMVSRLEEEKPEPNVSELLKQWRQDKQPGRAIVWANQHQDHIHQLPEALQQELQAFQDSFEEAIKEQEPSYLADIEPGLTLDGTNAKAREYFQCQDMAGLNSLLLGLQGHRDEEQSQHFLPLVEAYMAELSNDPKQAIEAYESVGEGPAQIDALTRLFELHIHKHELEPGLHVLKTLSDISSVYTPMYADLLQATGGVEEAVEIYTNYILENPDDLNSVMKLGKIYQEFGAADGVEWAMNYILSKDPDNHAAKAMLNDVKQQ